MKEEEDSCSQANWKPQSSSESGRQPGTTAANEVDSEGRAAQSRVGDTGQPRYATPELRSEAPAAASDKALMGTESPDTDRPLAVKTERKEGGEKKKVGRPIAFQGDINSPHLTEMERRQYRRRVTNRDSARRVRQKRQEKVADLQVRMAGVEARFAAMASQLEQAHVEKQELEQQMACLQQRWNRAHRDTSRVKVEDPQGEPAARERAGEMEHAVTKAIGGEVTAPLASAAATTNAVTSGQRRRRSTLSTGAAGFRPGAVVCSGGAQYSRAVVTGVPGAANVCATVLQDLTPSHLAACPPQQPAGGASIQWPVPDICLSPVSYPFNIWNLTSPFKHVAQTEPSSATVPDLATCAAYDGVMLRQRSSELLMWSNLSGRDPPELLFHSDQLLEPMTSDQKQELYGF